ncbi:MAG TPA: DUF262 domain-containing protein [Mucilaginibacter sp.]|nr:DUF262 domain-containing protein [Mucilaginibacter sp.]
MNIELNEISVRELAQGYEDTEENGVVGYNMQLDIRPKYQREFIYKDKQREAVIDTLIKGFPLNVMYWAVRKDGGFELIDGQQRTISICQFIEGEFSYNNRYFHNLQEDEREKILDYKLMVYVCSGTDSEKLDWFKTINIAGEKLTDQELRNAIYAGLWVTDAKRYFSKTNCAAYGLGGDYLTGQPIRQHFLETTIRWISGDKIPEYMAKHQDEPTANELWLYYQSVINWVKVVFPKYRKEMQGVQWGNLYNQFKDDKFDPKKIEEQIASLMMDDDVTKKSGIYEYILTGDEKYLNIRAFTPNQIRQAYERQKGICAKCGKYFELSAMEADHITPWHLGGKTSADNCQMLCQHDNRLKSGV